jgi:hypothetical protein
VTPQNISSYPPRIQAFRDGIIRIIPRVPNNPKCQQYDYLLRTNGNFRAYRMRKECGPIRDPGLRGSCIASFSAYEPVRR